MGQGARRLILLQTVLLAVAAAASLHEGFNPQQAYAYTSQVAGFGERWPGSPGHAKTEDLIHQVLRKDGAQIEADDFTAKTPRGAVAVHNIIGKFNVTADPKQKIFILAGHYDTLFQPGIHRRQRRGIQHGNSSGLCRRAGRAKNKDADLAGLDRPRRRPSNRSMPMTASTAAGTLQRNWRRTARRRAYAGFFLLDMIGDKDLSVARETGSARWLQDFIAAGRKPAGLRSVFFPL